jgi:hypothetical protein
MMQSMDKLYWPCLIAAAVFIGWCDTHTDEITLVLGFVLIVCGALGLLWPQYFLISGIVVGLSLFATESLVNLGLLNARYPERGGIPWPALLALIPAMIGAAAGAGIRRMTTARA